MTWNKKSIVSFFILLLLVTLFLFGFYGNVILHPDSFLYSAKGDGIKNYFTYAFYIKNNISYTNFEGMNYPYGENFMYTDCHPILAYLLKFFSTYFPGLSNHSIGILNLLLILSPGITIFILYFIFKELKINYLLSILGAIGITVLNPQIFRLTGHLALSYSFFIPLTIYLLLLYERNVRRKWIFFLLTISILFFFSIHAYLGMIASAMIFTYVIVGTINQYIVEKRINISKYSLMMMSSILPVILFYLFIKITDIHSGRTTNPWGIFENHADMATVFLPVFGGFIKIKDYLFPGLVQTWEGWSYIGVSTILMILFYLVVSVIRSIKGKTIALDTTWIDHVPLRQLFIASFLILAFSMFVPFRFHLEKFINYFDIIKQFRAIGRFAWVFYFVSTITLVYILNKAVQKLLAKKWNFTAYALIVLIPLSLFWEGLDYQTFTKNELTQSPNLFDITQTSVTLREDVQSINPGNYQAILSFPFFYVGSDNYGKAATDDKIYPLSFLFSYHLNLPLIESVLTRTSIYESKNIMQLLASNFYQKNIQNDLPGDKPFLLLCLNENLNATETNYIKKAKILVRRDQYSIYEINKEVFFENNAREEIEHFNNLKDNLFEKNGFLVSDTSLYFSFTDFKQAGNNLSFSGNNGCYSGLQRNYNTLLSIEKGKLQLNRKYTARFWMYNEGKNFGQDCLGGMIFIQKTTGDHIEWLNPFVSAGNSHEINNKWSLVELSFENTNNEAHYDLVLKGDDVSTKTIYLDDLLLYDNDLSVFKLDKSKDFITLFNNNQRIVTPNINFTN